jgi:hypothetical protein
MKQREITTTAKKQVANQILVLCEDIFRQDENFIKRLSKIEQSEVAKETYIQIARVFNFLGFDTPTEVSTGEKSWDETCKTIRARENNNSKDKK